MTPVRDGKEGFVQRYYQSGVLQQDREMGPTSENKKEKWRFLAKEQGEGPWMGNY